MKTAGIGFYVGSLMILVGCSSGGDSGVNRCVPGSTQACFGPGQCSGAQVCTADSVYGACDCGSAGMGGVGQSTGGDAGRSSSGGGGGTPTTLPDGLAVAWATSLGPARAEDVIAMPDGGAMVLGNSQETISTDGSTGTTVLARLDANGSPVWIKQYPGYSSSIARTDSLIVIGGEVTRSTFNPTPAYACARTLFASDVAYVAALTTDGDCVWSDVLLQSGLAVDVAARGDWIVVTGQSTTGPSEAVAGLTLGYDGTGKRGWSLPFGGTRVAVDEIANAYVAGYVTAGTVIGTHTFTGTGFVAQILAADHSAGWVWDATVGTYFWGTGLQVRDGYVALDGTVTQAGSIGPSATPGPVTGSDWTLFTATLDTSGVLTNFWRWPGTSTDVLGVPGPGVSVELTSDGRVMHCATVTPDVTIDSTTYSAIGDTDVMVGLTSADGRNLAFQRFGGTGRDACAATSTDAVGGAIVAATYQSGFQLGSTVLPAAPANSTNIVVARYERK